MDTDKKTQTLQTNTFAGGMNTDVADSLLKPSEYRLARNLRYVTDTEESTGEMRLVEDYDTLFQPIGEIIATKSIRNYGVIITKKVETESNELVTYWRIYRYDSTQPVSSGINPKLIFGPCSDELGDELSIVCRWESDNNVKVYIADGGEIMSINIAPSADLSTIPTTKNFLSSLNFTVLPKPEIHINQDGSAELKCPKLQYAYKLYRYGISETNISPFSEVLRVYKTNNTEYNGYEQDLIMNKSISVTIPNINIGNTDNCLIYRLSYITEGTDPVVDLIYDDLFDGTSITVIDKGLSLGLYTIQELLSEDTVQIKPKILESKNDYLFASNIEYIQDTFDLQIDLYYNKEDITYHLVCRNYQLDINGNDLGLQTDGNGNITRYPYTQSLHTGELYRYGIIFYDKKGRKSTVKHIADIEVPYHPLGIIVSGHENIYIPNYNPPYRTSDGNAFNLCAIGVNFDISGLSDNIKNICSGYEIVRCQRTIYQTRTIALGILSKTFDNGNGIHFLNPYLTTDKIKTVPYNLTPSINFGGPFSTSSDLLTFSCPEYCYFPEQFKLQIKQYKNSLYITPSIDYLPQFFNVTADFNQDGINETDYFIGDNNQLASAPFRFNKISTLENMYTGSITLFCPQTTYTVTATTLPPTALTTTGVGLYLIPYHVSSPFVYNVHTFCKVLPRKSISYPAWHYNNPIYDASVDYLIKENSIDFTESPDPSSFVNKADIFHFDSNYSDEDVYKNWFCDFGFSDSWYTGDYDASPWKQQLSRGYVDNSGETSVFKNGILSSGNRSIIFLAEGFNGIDDEYFKTDVESDVSFEDRLPISIFSLRKNTINDPYGDNKQSTYNSYGNYFNIEDVDQLGFAGVDIYDGDTFNTIFTFNSAHSVYGTSIKAVYLPSGVATKYIVPIETSIDLTSTVGDLLKDKISAMQDGGRHVYFQELPGRYYQYSQKNPAYVYNTAYYTDVRYPVFHSTYYADVYSGNYDTRVVYSLKKDNNEKVDSWSKFKAVNYLDVDSRYGQITDMRLFKNQLLFWLESATGILSSNEQQLILNPNGANLTLGTGDVLLRFDYITTVYGMKAGLFAEEQSNSYIYWWDDNKKKILQYGNGFSVLSDIKNVSNFINTGSSIEKPSIYYNKKYQEIWFSIISKPYIEYYTNPERFEFFHSTAPEITVLSSDYPLIYNENLQVFTGVYDTIFRNKLYFNDGDLLTESYSVNSVVKDGIPHLTPYLKYVVSASSGITKTYDLQEIGGTFYGNSSVVNIDSTTSVENKQNSLDLNNKYHSSNLSPLKFRFTTPLNQQAITNGSNISIREYNLKMDIPRNGGSALYGNRMRGKTMQCELLSTSASKDFALQYITTKFRISCS